MKILVVEDDESAAEILSQALKNQHYLVDWAADGQAGWNLAEAFEYDLILLDVMLPQLDGITLCKKLRQNRNKTAILLVTSTDSSTYKVNGLDAGADDYLVKPFDIQELLARVRALLRRGSASIGPIVQWRELCLDPTSCEVTYAQEPLPLTAKEYEILELLLRNPQRIFSPSTLIEHLWSFEELPSENVIRAHIKNLRQKLKTVGAPGDLIETVYGMGYRLQSTAKKVNPQQRKATDRPMGSATRATSGENQPPVPLNLSGIWDKYKEKYSDRVTTIERAVRAIECGNLSDRLWQEALREAHTLKGSLGSFGFENACNLCRQIEEIFKQQEQLTPERVEQLCGLVLALRQELGQQPTILQPRIPQPIPFKEKPRLLVVDDDTDLAETVILEAKAWGMVGEVAGDLDRARAAIATNPPDIVLLDLSFPDTAENGLTLLAELATAPDSVPVLVFSGCECFNDRVQVARLGARRFLHKPMSPGQIVDAIAQVLQQSTARDAKLLIVDDDFLILDYLRTLLEPWGFQLTLLQDPNQFWETLDRTDPDMLLLNIEMPQFNGIDLCAVVRNDCRWHELPIVFISGHTDTDTVNRMFAAGADDYLHKPIVGPELITRILKRLERTQLVRQLSEIDGLTGVSNRRTTVQQLNRLLHLAQRQNQPLCFMMLDIDHFKYINDRYGHEAGDRVLHRLGKLLKQSFRMADVIGRWGGEEFAIALYNMTRDQGVERLAELLATLNHQEFADAQNRSFRISFSAGVVEYPADGADLGSIYRAADRALYRAKSAGRNQIFTPSLEA